MKRILTLFGGAGIGALLGLLIGMSTSGTVAVVIGAITSVLIVLLGLKDTTDTEHHALRTGSFGFACAGALLLGVYLRAHNALAPDIQSEIQKWKNSGFDAVEAKQFVAFERLGIIPPQAVLDTSTHALQKARTSILYASEVTLQDCERLEGFQGYSLEEELNAYRSVGPVWKQVANGIAKHVAKAEQKRLLHLTKKCLCNE